MAEDGKKLQLDGNQLGVVGLKQTGGWILEEFLIDLRGERGQKIFTEMAENDEIIGAILNSIDMLIRQVDWNVQEASQDSVDLEAAQFLQECMEDMSHSFKDMVSEALSMLQYGWSWHEIVYKLRGGPGERDPTKRSKFSDGRIGW